jgi:hypothetical protein
MNYRIKKKQLKRAVANIQSEMEAGSIRDLVILWANSIQRHYDLARHLRKRNKAFQIWPLSIDWTPEESSRGNCPPNVMLDNLSKRLSKVPKLRAEDICMIQPMTAEGEPPNMFSIRYNHEYNGGHS